ncbi:MAG: alpha/beta hydrolase [Deltaproteobacteria bacterium]|nr:alpha/beta hydrolase [Deltaproteobacteria bacterium]
MPANSTTVRMMQTGARVLSTVSPPLGARVLQRLFLTPIRHRTPERELGWLRGARRLVVSFDETRQLPVYLWGRGPTILLVHGWSGRGSQLGSMVAPLLESGYRVVAFDAPGHGAADGDRSALPELAQAIEKVVELVGPIEGVVAHSLGCAAASLALARGLEARRLVFLAPPSNPGAYLQRAAELLGFSPRVAAGARSRIEESFGVDFDDARIERLAPRIAANLLVIHDSGDEEVPLAEGMEVVAAWPGAELKITHGLGHRRILRDSAVVEAAMCFLTRPEDREDEAA